MGAEERIGGINPFASVRLVPGSLESDQKIGDQQENRESIYSGNANFYKLWDCHHLGNSGKMKNCWKKGSTTI